MELFMHRHLAERRAAREWFRITPEEARAAYAAVLPELEAFIRERDQDIRYQQRRFRKRLIELDGKSVIVSG